MIQDREVDNYMVSPAALDKYYGGQSRRALSEPARLAYAETERRLYAMPLLLSRVQENREELEELEQCGIEALKSHSASLVRLLRPGIRLTPEEVHAAQMAQLRGRLAADEREIKKMQAALSCISDDPYYVVIELKYFQNVKDADVAERVRCDPTTVRRNRTRLLRRLSLRLYGTDALY